MVDEAYIECLSEAADAFRDDRAVVTELIVAVIPGKRIDSIATVERVAVGAGEVVDARAAVLVLARDHETVTMTAFTLLAIWLIFPAVAVGVLAGFGPPLPTKRRTGPKRCVSQPASPK